MVYETNDSIVAGRAPRSRTEECGNVTECATKRNANPKRQRPSECSRDDLLRKYIYFFLHELHFQCAVRVVCVVSACGLCVCECAEQQQINPVLMVKTLRIIQFDCTGVRSGWEKLLFFSLLTLVFCESLFWVYIDSIASFFPVLIYLTPFPHSIYESDSFPTGDAFW